jgi:urease accessory protein
MLRLVSHGPRGHWPSAEAKTSVTLDFDARHRRRIRLQLDDGSEALLDLERAVAMAGGDGLATADGAWIAVKAAPEPLVEVTASDQLLFLRLAWHLGNRHVPAEITRQAILIRPDHVLEEMLVNLGASARHVTLPFQPEGGAYGDHGHGDGHHHEHGHGHGHGYGHDHAHG